MNNLEEIAQTIGLVSIFLIFILKLYIAVVPSAFLRAGRAAILWFTIYVFFLFTIRFLSYFELATLTDLRIISGFSTLIPLIAIILHLFLGKRVEKSTEKIVQRNQEQEAHTILDSQL